MRLAAPFTALACACALLLACAARELPPASSLAPRDGFLLVRIVAYGLPFTLVVFRNVDTNEDVSVPIRKVDTLGIVRAPAGRYFLRRVDTAYVDLPSFVVEPDAPSTFQIVAGAVSYAGDWTIVGRGAPKTAPAIQVGVDYSVVTIEQARAKHPSAFAGSPVALAVQGKDATVLVPETAPAREPSTANPGGPP